MAKYIVQIVILGTQALGKAFTRALKEEYTASQAAAASRRGTPRGGGSSSSSSSSSSDSRTAAENMRLGLSVEEARQILNIKPESTQEEINKIYETMFNLNDKVKGGSFYIQSKIYRAKERLDEEYKIQLEINKKKTTSSDDTTSQSKPSSSSD